MNYFDIREAELNDKLRRIYAERYELIKMSDVRLRSENEVLKTLFMSNVMKAQFRNQLIVKECDKILRDVDKINKYDKEEDKRFKILKSNYLSMTKSIYPEWVRELDEYKKRRNALAIRQQQQQQQEEDDSSVKKNKSKKTISKSLPVVNENNEDKPKRRRTPRELMNELEKSAGLEIEN